MKMRPLTQEEYEEIRSLAVAMLQLAHARALEQGLDNNDAGNRISMAVSMIISSIADAAELHLSRDTRFHAITAAIMQGAKTFHNLPAAQRTLQ